MNKKAHIIKEIGDSIAGEFAFETILPDNKTADDIGTILKSLYKQEPVLYNQMVSLS